MADEQPTSESIWLWPGTPPETVDGFRPWLEPFLLEDRPSAGAVLIAPGGGYRYRSWPKEGLRVAERFNREGWHAFVLAYRVFPHHHPAALLDARRAMQIIRHNADAWGVRSDRIAACGFSAGGHLVGSLALLDGHEDLAPSDAISKLPTRPDALVLSYPVITAGEYADQRAIDNLLPEGADKALQNEVSLERHVRADMPPTFLWHTAVDTIAPVENSLLFALACHSHRIPLELHVYPEGRHGMGLAVAPARVDPHVATWMPLCCEWLRTLGW